MTTDNHAANLIESVASACEIIELLADFQPRRLKDILIALEERGNEWSQTKVYALLATLAARRWVDKQEDGYYTLSPYLVSIAVAWQKTLTIRASAIRRELDTITALANSHITTANPESHANGQ
jgi:DNA-binding IclR family transcriptional regulator